MINPSAVILFFRSVRRGARALLPETRQEQHDIFYRFGGREPDMGGTLYRFTDLTAAGIFMCSEGKKVAFSCGRAESRAAITPLARPDSNYYQTKRIHKKPVTRYTVSVRGEEIYAI